MSISHEARPRGGNRVPGSVSTAGRFGRMFRNLPPSRHDQASLVKLAASMMQDPDTLEDRENRRIPAGYTYLGQFITHDLTFDPASSFQRQNDPNAIQNFRTPRFDLDSIYGGGPDQQPYLYRSGSRSVPHLALGFDQRRTAFLLAGEEGTDVPRNAEGRALIADPRNDEHLIISQLHVAFLRFHNHMVEQIHRDHGLEGDALFEEAQRLVRWHYQWVVLHDYLPRILGADVPVGRDGEIVGNLLRLEPVSMGFGMEALSVRSNLRFYGYRKSAFIPVEFSAAAFRFGHAMVRPSYFINDAVRVARSGAAIPVFSADENPLASLRGSRPLPKDWAVDWRFFFDLGGFEPQWAFKFSPSLVAALGGLDELAELPSLALRDLLRGNSLGLPSGQSVARTMGISPLSDAELGLSARGCPELEGDAPLWFYILREAEVIGQAHALGPVGGCICAEVLVGLMLADPFSYLNVDPGWSPADAREGGFGMAELLGLADDAGPSAASFSGAVGEWRSAFRPPDAPVGSSWP